MYTKNQESNILFFKQLLYLMDNKFFIPKN